MKPKSSFIQHRINYLRQIPYFSVIDAGFLKPIAQTAVSRKYDSGQIVILEGDLNSGLFIVEAGCVKITKVAVDGKEQILQIIGPNETFNSVGVFTAAPNPATVIALELSTLLIIQRELMQQLLIKHPNLAQYVIEELSNQILNLIDLVDDLSLRKLESRIAKHIIEKSIHNKIVRKQWATQTEIAARMGTVPDVISRIMRKFVEEGIIDVDRREILIIDRLKLENKATPDH